MKELLKNWLDKREWSYLENEDIIKIDVSGKKSSWTSFIKTDEKDCFSYFSVLPTRIPEDRISFILELLDRVNCRLWFGNYELILDEGRGQLRLRTSSILPESADEKAVDMIIEGNLTLNMAIMDRYESVFTKAIYSTGENAADFLK